MRRNVNTHHVICSTHCDESSKLERNGDFCPTTDHLGMSSISSHSVGQKPPSLGRLSTICAQSYALRTDVRKARPPLNKIAHVVELAKRVRAESGETVEIAFNVANHIRLKLITASSALGWAGIPTLTFCLISHWYSIRRICWTRTCGRICSQKANGTPCNQFHTGRETGNHYTDLRSSCRQRSRALADPR